MQQVAGAKYVFASFRSLLKLQNVDGPWQQATAALQQSHAIWLTGAV